MDYLYYTLYAVTALLAVLTLNFFCVRFTRLKAERIKAENKESIKQSRELAAKAGCSRTMDYAYNRINYIKNQLQEHNTKFVYHFEVRGAKTADELEVNGIKLVMTSKALGREVTITMMPTWGTISQLILEDREYQKCYYPEKQAYPRGAKNIDDLIEWVKHCMETPCVGFC